MKGNGLGYWGLHLWIRRHRACSNICEACGASGCRIELANDDHRYTRDPEDYVELRKKCRFRRQPQGARSAPC
jgi:hypothetical protein